MVNKFHRSYGTGAGADSKAADKNTTKHTVSGAKHSRSRPFDSKEATAASTACRDNGEPLGVIPLGVIPQPIWTRNLLEQLEYLLKPSTRRFWERNCNSNIHAFDGEHEVTTAAIPSSELVEAQAAFLSSIDGFATLAPSIAYTFVEHQYQQTQDTDSSAQAQQQPQQDRRALQTSMANKQVQFKREEEEAQLRSLCVAASNASHAARSEYTKHWRLRLERTSPSSLTRTERAQLLSVWYRLRRSADAYSAARRALRAHFNKKNGIDYDCSSDLSDNFARAGFVQDDTAGENHKEYGQGCVEDADVTKTRSLLVELIDNFPTHPPHAVAGEDSIHSHSQAHHTARTSTHDTLAAHHASFTASVSYVAEAAMGGFLLRDVVQQLKICSEHELECEANGQPGYSREKWREALKSYKALHCCLQTNGASDAASCMFLEKLSNL